MKTTYILAGLLLATFTLSSCHTLEEKISPAGILIAGTAVEVQVGTAKRETVGCCLSHCRR